MYNVPPNIVNLHVNYVGKVFWPDEKGFLVKFSKKFIPKDLGLGQKQSILGKQNGIKGETEGLRKQAVRVNVREPKQRELLV